LLVVAGIPASSALLATLAYRIVSFWLPLLAGPVAWLLFRHCYHQPLDLEHLPSPPRDLLDPATAPHPAAVSRPATPPR
jgi:hypothetical protein